MSHPEDIPGSSSRAVPRRDRLSLVLVEETKARSPPSSLDWAARGRGQTLEEDTVKRAPLSLASGWHYGLRASDARRDLRARRVPPRGRRESFLPLLSLSDHMRLKPSPSPREESVKRDDHFAPNHTGEAHLSECSSQGLRSLSRSGPNQGPDGRALSAPPQVLVGPDSDMGRVYVVDGADAQVDQGHLPRTELQVSHGAPARQLGRPEQGHGEGALM